MFANEDEYPVSGLSLSFFITCAAAALCAANLWYENSPSAHRMRRRHQKFKKAKK
jgi:hypothetical protein